MSKTPRRAPEHAVRKPPEKAVIPLTQAEADAAARLAAISAAIQEANNQKQAAEVRYG